MRTKLSYLLIFLVCFYPTFLSPKNPSNGDSAKKLTHSVKNLRKTTGRVVYLVPALHPTLFINKKVSWKKYRGFIDTIVENDYGNTLRAFSAGSWEGGENKKMRFPFKKVRGKFDLRKIDKTWLTETLRRIRYFVEKDGVVIYTLIDGCSLYQTKWHRNGFWAHHWWNGDNNINGTSNQSASIKYMFDFTIPGAETTRYYVMQFLEFMVSTLEEEFPGFIVYDFNEFDAPLDWYMQVHRQIFQKHKIPRHRKMFSSVREEENIHLLTDRYVYQAHGIGSLDDYLAMEISIPETRKIMFSADGCLPVNRKVTKQLVYRILKAGHVGFENNRYWWPGVKFEEQVNWDYARGMKQGLLKWLRMLK